MPSRSGMTVSDTTNSADGSTNRMRLPCSPRMTHLADAQADAPQDVGEHRGLPVRRTRGPRCPVHRAPGRRATTSEDEEGPPDEDPTRRLRASEMSCVGDDVDEVAVAHVLGPAHEDGGLAPSAALRAMTVGCAATAHPGMVTHRDEARSGTRSVARPDGHSSPSEALYSLIWLSRPIWSVISSQPPRCCRRSPAPWRRVPRPFTSSSSARE